jgi:hypothetical protein
MVAATSSPRRSIPASSCASLLQHTLPIALLLTSAAARPCRPTRTTDEERRGEDGGCLAGDCVSVCASLTRNFVMVLGFEGHCMQGSMQWLGHRYRCRRAFLRPILSAPSILPGGAALETVSVRQIRSTADLSSARLGYTTHDTH